MGDRNHPPTAGDDVARLGGNPAAAGGERGEHDDADIPEYARRSSFTRSLYEAQANLEAAGLGGRRSGAGGGAGASGGRSSVTGTGGAGARSGSGGSGNLPSAQDDSSSAAAEAAAIAAVLPPTSSSSSGATAANAASHHMQSSAPGGLALQVLDSLENNAGDTTTATDEFDLYPVGGAAGRGGGRPGAGRDSGSSIMEYGHASDGAPAFGGGGAAAAAAAAAASGRQSSSQRKQRDSMYGQVGRGYSETVVRERLGAEEEQMLREHHRIMALNEARERTIEQTGYDPATTFSPSDKHGAAGEGDENDEDAARGRIRNRTPRERPPPPKPRRGRPAPPPKAVEPPMPSPRGYVARIDDKYTAEWRRVPDLCTGEPVELKGGGNGGGGGEGSTGSDTAAPNVPTSILLQRGIVGDHEHLVRCLNCSRGLRVHKMASLVRCRICSGVSPANTLR